MKFKQGLYRGHIIVGAWDVDSYEGLMYVRTNSNQSFLGNLFCFLVLEPQPCGSRLIPQLSMPSPLQSYVTRNEGVGMSDWA